MAVGSLVTVMAEEEHNQAATNAPVAATGDSNKDRTVNGNAAVSSWDFVRPHEGVFHSVFTFLQFFFLPSFKFSTAKSENETRFHACNNLFCFPHNTQLSSFLSLFFRKKRFRSLEKVVQRQRRVFFFVFFIRAAKNAYYSRLQWFSFTVWRLDAEICLFCHCWTFAERFQGINTCGLFPRPRKESI